MRLSSQNSQFVFGLSQTFVPEEITKKYQSYIDKTHNQYDDIQSYLNSTVKGISMPGLELPVVEQTGIYSKKLSYRGSSPSNDTFSRELTITFKSVDSHINWLIMQEIAVWWYRNTDVKEIHAPPFFMAVLDWNRDAMFYVKFTSVTLKAVSEITLSYAEQSLEEKVFTVSFVFNWFDIEYLPLKKNLLRNKTISNQIQEANRQLEIKREAGRKQYESDNI